MNESIDHKTDRLINASLSILFEVVSDIHMNYPGEVLSPQSMVLANLTIFDKGEYNCTVNWNGIGGDHSWHSTPLQLNVYDCIDLEEQVRKHLLCDTKQVI